jgi:lipoate-protein ligase A
MTGLESGNCDFRNRKSGISPISVKPVFSRLSLWLDDDRRSGPENMAVDEWLLQTTVCSVLRVYSWEEGWGSLGYFGALAEAKRSFDEVRWVRRWTGGGIVDHRSDWTYTLVVPSNEEVAKLRGAESYRLIHQALARVASMNDLNVRLSSGMNETGDSCCFVNPVEHDLVDASGRKIAGAGQRRTKLGLLHQGSVAGRLEGPESIARAEALAAILAETVEEFTARPDPDDLAQRVASRYGNPAWTERR